MDGAVWAANSSIVIVGTLFEAALGEAALGERETRTVNVHGTDGVAIPRVYESVVNVTVGDAGELYLHFSEGGVEIHATGTWSRVEAVPVDKDGEACDS